MGEVVAIGETLPSGWEDIGGSTVSRSWETHEGRWIVLLVAPGSRGWRAIIRRPPKRFRTIGDFPTRNEAIAAVEAAYCNARVRR